MLLYIIRHGDPIYDPDSITELGKLQAAALAKRLARKGIDRIYSSPKIRAQQTAEPTSILTKKEVLIEEWTSEDLAFRDFSEKIDDHYRWIFQSRKKLLRASVQELGEKWYEAECFKNAYCKRGYDRIADASDKFLEKLGYLHDREKCCYYGKNPNSESVAVFCHAGFGMSWIGALLDIPLPIIWANTDIDTTGVTVIKFTCDDEGVCIPQMLTFSNDAHLYKEDLPIRF